MVLKLQFTVLSLPLNFQFWRVFDMRSLDNFDGFNLKFTAATVSGVYVCVCVFKFEALPVSLVLSPNFVRYSSVDNLAFFSGLHACICNLDDSTCFQLYGSF